MGIQLMYNILLVFADQGAGALSARTASFEASPKGHMVQRNAGYLASLITASPSATVLPVTVSKVLKSSLLQMTTGVMVA